jgi:hypothetical protein
MSSVKKTAKQATRPCGKLLVFLYSTRPAASNWHKCYPELLQMHGFRVTRAVIGRGDDVVATGEGDDFE